MVQQTLDVPSTVTLADEEPDDLLPVRMINEFVYCPRLFWLMHVCGIEAKNEHVIRGLSVHRRVDKRGGTLPAPDAPGTTDAEPWHARALWLSSPRLGISGKIDLVEETEDAVMPVDTKKGRPAPNARLWPSDEVQLVLQALLLRDAGYRCRAVGAFYVETRQRVVVELTPELEARALRAVEEARSIEGAAIPPPPLIDSPKCPGCAHNAICQPDETNQILGRLDNAVELRRVVPVAEDAVPLTVLDPGARIGIEGESLLITPRQVDAPPQRIGLGTVASVNVFGTAQITTSALRTCCDRGIPISFFSTSGWFYGRAQGHDSNYVAVRVGQYRAYETDRALGVARVLIGDKIANTRTLLRRNRLSDDEGPLGRLKHLHERAREAPSPATLLGIEGEAASLAWPEFDALVSKDDERFKMHGRNRRPPPDPVNAMLGYLYGMLVRDATNALAVAGLDPYLGLYHTVHHGRPALALDLMEPFRPLVAESVVLGIVRRGELKPDAFVRTGPGVVMKDGARRTVVAAYERRMSEAVSHPVFGYRITYRQVLGVQARLLARVMSGEIPELPSFVTR